MPYLLPFSCSTMGDYVENDEGLSIPHKSGHPAFQIKYSGMTRGQGQLISQYRHLCVATWPNKRDPSFPKRIHGLSHPTRDILFLTLNFPLIKRNTELPEPPHTGYISWGDAVRQGKQVISGNSLQKGQQVCKGNCVVLCKAEDQGGSL